MNDTQEALIRRIRALIEQKPADLAGDVARIAFDANERIEVVGDEVVATFAGEVIRVPVPIDAIPEPIAKPETTQELQS